MNYGKYAEKAYEKIRKYGSAITVRRGGKKVYDPETNAYEEFGEEFGGVALQRSFSQKNIDGINVKFGDVLFMACVDGKPQSDDTVIFGDRKFTVVNVEFVNPDGMTDIFVRIQAR